MTAGTRLNENHIVILMYLNEHPLATTAEVASGCDIPPSRAYDRLISLCAAGKVARQPGFTALHGAPMRWQVTP